MANCGPEQQLRQLKRENGVLSREKEKQSKFHLLKIFASIVKAHDYSREFGKRREGRELYSNF